jgi:hypothetical protein
MSDNVQRFTNLGADRQGGVEVPPPVPGYHCHGLRWPARARAPCVIPSLLSAVAAALCSLRAGSARPSARCSAAKPNDAIPFAARHRPPRQRSLPRTQTRTESKTFAREGCSTDFARRNPAQLSLGPTVPMLGAPSFMLSAPATETRHARTGFVSGTGPPCVLQPTQPH